MSAAKPGSYKGLTEARKRANKKYNDRFVEIKVRVTPEKRSIIKEHAESMGESATAFINRAIDEAMARDQKTDPEKQKNTVTYGYISTHHRMILLFMNNRWLCNCLRYSISEHGSHLKSDLKYCF